MRHPQIVIEATDLYNRLTETDNIADSADWIGAGELFGADGGFSGEKNTWYIVEWPQHVVTPRYNGDCSCSGPFGSREEAEAHEPAAKVYA